MFVCRNKIIWRSSKNAFIYTHWVKFIHIHAKDGTRTMCICIYVSMCTISMICYLMCHIVCKLGLLNNCSSEFEFSLFPSFLPWYSLFVPFGREKYPIWMFLRIHEYKRIYFSLNNNIMAIFHGMQPICDVWMTIHWAWSMILDIDSIVCLFQSFVIVLWRIVTSWNLFAFWKWKCKYQNEINDRD